MNNPSLTPEPARPSGWPLLAAACVSLFAVVVNYSLSGWKGGWPPGHPWSGVTHVALAAALFARWRGGRVLPFRKAMIIGMGMLATVSALLWLASGVLRFLAKSGVPLH